MSSTISYRFKNSISTETVSFTGSVITIGDVKRLIAIKRGLGAEGAPELSLFDSSTGEPYSDDAKVIPRNSLVIVKRAPLARLAPLQASAADGSGGGGKEAGATTNGGGSAAAAAGGGDEFGGEYYSDRPQAAVVGEDEDRALQTLLQGTASTWQREVRQGALRGRGLGRGRGAPLDYRCPRCEAIGQHWVSDCPTQGDPNFDKRRVRPPVGIPMTRLARAAEGGLVLPDGQTGTLIANEDAFAREILGLPTAAPAAAAPEAAQAGSAGAAESKPALLPAPVEAEGKPAAAAETKPPLLLLDSKPAGEGAAPEVAPVAPAAAVPMPTLPPPRLAGEAELSGGVPARAPSASLFGAWMAAGLLPRGPPDFLRRAFDREEPLPRAEFERTQDDYRRRFQLPRLLRVRAASPRRRSPSRRSRSRERSHRSKERSPERSRDKSRDKSRDRSNRAERGDRERPSADRKERRHSHSRGRKERRRSKSRSRERSKRRESGADEAPAKEQQQEQKQDQECVPSSQEPAARLEPSAASEGRAPSGSKAASGGGEAAGEGQPRAEGESKKDDRPKDRSSRKERHKEKKEKKAKRHKEEHKDRRRSRSRERREDKERSSREEKERESKRSRK